MYAETGGGVVTRVVGVEVVDVVGAEVLVDVPGARAVVGAGVVLAASNGDSCVAVDAQYVACSGKYTSGYHSTLTLPIQHAS